MEITFKVLLENGIRSRQLCQFWERERLNIFPSNFINFQPFFPFLYFIPFRIFHTTFIPFLLFLPVLLESKRIGTRVSISTSSPYLSNFDSSIIRTVHFPTKLKTFDPRSSSSTPELLDSWGKRRHIKNSWLISIQLGKKSSSMEKPRPQAARMVEIRAFVIIRRSLRSRLGRFAVGMGSRGRRRGLIRRRGGRYEALEGRVLGGRGLLLLPEWPQNELWSNSTAPA